MSELVSISLGREAIYSFLSRSFMDPVNGNYFQQIESFLALAENMKGSNEKLDAGLEMLKQTVEKRNSLEGKELKEYDLDILREYTMLFCMGSTVPTSESVYVSPKHLTMQEPRDEMLALFREAGLGQNPKYNEPEDHIANEMSIMAWYCHRTAQSIMSAGFAIEKDDSRQIEENIDRQLHMHEAHFARWISRFAADIYKINRQAHFYDAVAMFMEGFLQEDYELVKEMKG